MIQRRKTWCAVVLVAALSLLLWGCDGGEKKAALNYEDLPEGKAEEQAAATAKSLEAQGEMERVLTDIRGADEVQLDQIDFSKADQFYQEAIAEDPKNTEAQFGAALTHLLTLTNNTELQSVQDSLNTYMENGEKDQVVFVGGISAGNAAKVVGKLPLMQAKMVVLALDDRLTASDMQKAIEEEVIPAIDYSLERLHLVEGDSSFTFTLTPEMLGDEQENPREIDLGEAFMLDAQLRLLKGVLLVATAYDFDLDEEGSYAFLDDDTDENVLRQLERLDKTGSFLTLKSAGRMQEAKASILSAIDKMEQGLAAVRQEVDDQENDVIRKEDISDLDEELDLSDQEDLPMFFRDIRTSDDALRKAREALESQVSIEADFDGNEETPKSTVVFELGRFFDNPIRDFRTLLPYHEWHRELLNNRDFTDELVLTDDQGQRLGASPSLIFPDPSFGGILSNIATSQELLELFGIRAEHLNEKDLLHEMGFLSARDGGIIVTNNTAVEIEVVYSTNRSAEQPIPVPPDKNRDGKTISASEDQHVPVAPGETKDVVRAVLGKALDGNEYYALRVLAGGRVVYEGSEWGYYVDGDVYIAVASDQLSVDRVDGQLRYEIPSDPYVRETYPIEPAIR